MKAKERIGIILGIILAVIVPVISLGILSKDDQKGRTEPVLQYEWEQAVFDHQTIQKTLDDLGIKEIKGFLFQKDSRTPLYFAVYIGKSPKGKDAVKNYFKNITKFPTGFKIREESALKILGEQNPDIYSGKDVDHKAEINFSGDYIVVSYAPQSTNIVLDDPQKTHFIHRYFRKKTKEKSEKETGKNSK